MSNALKLKHQTLVRIEGTVVIALQLYWPVQPCHTIRRSVKSLSYHNLLNIRGCGPSGLQTLTISFKASIEPYKFHSVKI